jgi:hypothetical protein
MLTDQTDQRIQVLFSDQAVSRPVLVELSVVDLDRERDLVLGLEIVCALRSLRSRGTEANMPDDLPPEVRYDPISDGLYIELNRDQEPQYPLRQLPQPYIRTHVLLSAVAEIVGVTVDLPPEKPWPGCSRRAGPR